MMDAQARFRASAIDEITQAECISLSEFARRLGVTRQRAHAWAQGRVSPQFTLVVAMAREFGRDLEYFVQQPDTDVEHAAARRCG